MTERINSQTDMLTEILAILLYQNDSGGTPSDRWSELHPEDREAYRKSARGEEPLFE